MERRAEGAHTATANGVAAQLPLTVTSAAQEETRGEKEEEEE